jgi:hypothetical protein
MENLMKYAVVKAVVFVCVGALFAQTNLQPLATIKIAKPSEQITVRDLRNRVEAYEKQRGKPLTVDERKIVLDALIDEKLVVQAALAAQLVITGEQVNQFFLSSFSQQAGRAITEQELSAIIKAQTGKTLDEYIKEETGMTVADYKSFLKNQLLIQQYIMREKKPELDKIMPTDKEIRDHYALYKTTYVRSDLLRLFLVIALKGTNPAQARTNITAVYGEIKEKSNFDEVAKRSDSNIQAGDIPVERTPEQAQRLGISGEALNEFFSRSVGFVSDIQETDKDFQFYVVRERFDGKMLSLDDEVSPGASVTLYEYVRAQLRQAKQAEYLDKTKNEIPAKLRTPQNFEMLKQGEELNKLLAW